MTTATVYHSRPVSTNDRFGVTLFFAIAFHAVVILGVTFDYTDRDQEKSKLPTLDVTLVHTRSNQAPEEADYLAQANQEGSGNTQEKERPKSPPESSPEVIPSPGNSAKTKTPVQASRQTKPLEKNVMTVEQAPVKVMKGEETPFEDERIPIAAELVRKSIEMARLEAELSETIEVYSKKPKSKLLVPNSMSHVEAAYLDTWQKKVELIGNMNYPEKAKRSNLSGSLLLLVAINADGTLNKIDLLRSSGHKILDDAAMRIVKLAAPYPPLPEIIREQADVLQIPRTWKFMSGNRLRTQ